jgi:hypothetical protein
MGELGDARQLPLLFGQQKLNLDLHGYFNRGPVQLTVQESGYECRANED